MRTKGLPKEFPLTSLEKKTVSFFFHQSAKLYGVFSIVHVVLFIQNLFYFIFLPWSLRVRSFGLHTFYFAYNFNFAYFLHCILHPKLKKSDAEYFYTHERDTDSQPHHRHNKNDGGFAEFHDAATGRRDPAVSQ